jgi:hypothetical protein
MVLTKFTATESRIRRETPVPDTMEIYAKKHDDTHF